jgi:hypothetical protein
MCYHTVFYNVHCGEFCQLIAACSMHLDRTLDTVLAGTAHLYGMQAAATCA